MDENFKKVRTISTIISISGSISFIKMLYLVLLKFNEDYETLNRMIEIPLSSRTLDQSWIKISVNI